LNADAIGGNEGCIISLITPSVGIANQEMHSIYVVTTTKVAASLWQYNEWIMIEAGYPIQGNHV
jgi:hypothetical protein